MITWTSFLQSEKEKDYFKHIIAQVQEDAKTHTVYPNRDDIFNAFKLSPFNKTKVVIVGMDPYINPGQAHGLSFSVPKGIEPPPSLKNIFKELKTDLNIDLPSHGCLSSWAAQGVLLLNTYLTVRQGETGSHSKFGWQTLTDSAISLLNEKDEPLVFMLWGNHAKLKRDLITDSKHLILQSGHPSPLSCRLFFDCKHFSKCNDFLTANGFEPIDWALKD